MLSGVSEFFVRLHDLVHLEVMGRHFLRWQASGDHHLEQDVDGDARDQPGCQGQVVDPHRFHGEFDGSSMNAHVCNVSTWLDHRDAGLQSDGDAHRFDGDVCALALSNLLDFVNGVGAGLDSVSGTEFACLCQAVLVSINTDDAGRSME